MMIGWRNAKVPMLRAAVACVVVFGLAAAVRPAVGDDMARLPSAEHGHRLAINFCSNCHVVDSDRKSAAQDGIPTFFVIANRIEQTKERILGALIDPHPPMPQPPLSMSDMIDIIAYLDSLRDTAVGPPLLPPTGRPKPPVEQQPS